MQNVYKKMPALIGSGLMLTLLASCAVGPNYVRPQTDVPAQFKHADTAALNPNWQLAHPKDDAFKGEWWKSFQDPILDDLMSQLLLNNQTIQMALANYQKAQGSLDAARAAYAPTLGAAADTARARSSTNSLGDSDSLKLSASWEPDLWGSIRRSVAAGRDNALAVQASLLNAQLSEQAALAQAYVALRIIDKERVITTQIIAQYQHSLDVVQNQYAQGLITPVDVNQAKTSLNNLKKQLLAYELSRTQYEDAIAVLVGQQPSQFNLAQSTQMPVLFAVPAVLPSTLLEHRPDVANAERLMMAANEQIGIAKAAYYPTLNLSANGGWGANLMSDLINPSNLIWSIGAGLIAPIFNGGATKAQVKQAQASYQAALAQYRQTVLSAMQAAEDNLSAQTNLSQQNVYQQIALTAARDADKQMYNQYEAGLVDYTSVISTQAARYSAEISSLQLLGQQYSTQILLIQNFGGGL